VPCNPSFTLDGTLDGGSTPLALAFTANKQCTGRDNLSSFTCKWTTDRDNQLIFIMVNECRSGECGGAMSDYAVVEGALSFALSDPSGSPACQYKLAD
jgi:hypothetical protein